MDATISKFGVFPSNGISGVLSIANPSDGCSNMSFVCYNSSSPSIVLMERGNCDFGDKVLNAQLAGCAGAIVYDNVPESLIVMYSTPNGVIIPSVFISKDSSSVFLGKNGTVTIGQNNPTFPPYITTFISIIASAVFMLAAFLFYRHRSFMRRQTPIPAAPRRDVQLPSETFDPARFPNASQCCICLEDFSTTSVVSKLRCDHVFHKACVERWLSQGSNTKCPLCKQEAVDTETTPLLI